MRVDWEQILKPCRGNLAWGVSLPGWEVEHRTDPDVSYISMWDIRPCGEFSRFSIRTVTSSGQEKTIGGDSWRVQLKGPASVAGTVFDHMNGTYEIVFLITEPGNYQVEAVLDHSLCNGFRDPPSEWFIVGKSITSRAVVVVVTKLLNNDNICNISINSTALIYMNNQTEFHCFFNL